MQNFFHSPASLKCKLGSSRSHGNFSESSTSQFTQIHDKTKSEKRITYNRIYKYAPPKFYISSGEVDIGGG